MPIKPATFSGVTADGVEMEGQGFTIRGFKDRSEATPMSVSIGRLHVSPKQRTSGVVEDGAVRTKPNALREEKKELDKLITIVVWQDPENVLEHIVLEEDHFIKGLQHLFPHGELLTSGEKLMGLLKAFQKDTTDKQEG